MIATILLEHSVPVAVLLIGLTVWCWHTYVSPVSARVIRAWWRSLFTVGYVVTPRTPEEEAADRQRARDLKVAADRIRALHDEEDRPRLQAIVTRERAPLAAPKRIRVQIHSQSPRG